MSQTKSRFLTASKGRQKPREELTLQETYFSHTKRSARMYREARKFFTGGQSHNARFFDPYPFFASKARGQYVWDVDGNRYTDYWMGHTALILGHSPKVVTVDLERQIKDGLLFGAPNELAFELGELVSKTVPCADSIRFCVTGAEATMYAIRLARAYTKRKVVAKIAGGWHGYNTSLLTGVNPPYDVPESTGLLPNNEKFSRLIDFNDIESAKEILSQNKSELAAVILEPLLGAGGVIPATREYLCFLREECDRIGAVLIFDEIITGFRLALGGAQEFYDVRPDLCTLGKILGGGLPVSAIAGNEEIMSLADTTVKKDKKERCWIGGGTFSENALCMSAGIATLRHLFRNKRSIYRALAAKGEEVRKRVDAAFSENRIKSMTTGVGSLFSTHLLSPNQDDITSPNDVNGSLRNLTMKYHFSLIAKFGIYFLPCHVGAISTAHGSSDIERFIKSTESIATELNAPHKA